MLIDALLYAVVGMVGSDSQPVAAQQFADTSAVQSYQAVEPSADVKQAYLPYYRFEPTLHASNEVHATYLPYY